MPVGKCAAEASDAHSASAPARPIVALMSPGYVFDVRKTTLTPGEGVAVGVAVAVSVGVAVVVAVGVAVRVGVEVADAVADAASPMPISFTFCGLLAP